MFTYCFIRDLITFLKYKKIIDNIYSEYKIKDRLTILFKTNIKKDWIGRIYFIINPWVNVDENDRIFGSDGVGYNIDDFINKWIFEKLSLLSNIISTHVLFDILTYRIEKIDEYNYLFILESLAYPAFKKSLRNFIIAFTIFILVLVTSIIIL